MQKKKKNELEKERREITPSRQIQVPICSLVIKATDGQVTHASEKLLMQVAFIISRCIYLLNLYRMAPLENKGTPVHEKVFPY